MRIDRAIVAVALFTPWVLFGDSVKGVSFSDNFSPPSALWSNTSGNWTASGGQYYAQNPHNTPPPAATLLPFDLTDFSFTVTVNSLADGGFFVGSDPALRNGILIVTGGLGYGQGQRGGNAGTALYYHDITNGQYSGVNGEVDQVFTPGDNYALKVTAEGSQLEVYVNGSTTPSLDFNDPTYTHGEIGVYDDQPNIGGGGSGPNQTFSNFSLTGTVVLPGDADLDGMVGFDDLVTLARNYGKNNAKWQDGDFNGDGNVGFDDLVILARNYGKTVTAAELASLSPSFRAEVEQAFADVPEPSVTAFVLLGSTMFLRRRRS